MADLLQHNYSSVYFIKDFPGQSQQELVQDTFFSRPTQTHTVNDAVSVVNAIKNDLRVSHVIGVVECDKRNEQEMAQALTQRLAGLGTQENLDIILVDKDTDCPIEQALLQSDELLYDCLSSQFVASKDATGTSMGLDMA